MLSLKLLIFVVFEIIVSEELANPQPDLSLCPLFKEFSSDLFEIGGSKLDDTSNEFLILLFAPVVALLDIEVFEVEAAVTETNLIVA